MDAQESVYAPFQDQVKKKPFFSLKRIIAVSIGTIIGVPLMLVSFVHFQSAVFTKASDEAPRDVVVSSITSTSANVQWYTDQESQAVIIYGTDPQQLRFFAPDQTKTKEHSVTISLLVPKTAYHFAIKIGDTVYDNGGVPYTFSTKPVDAELSTTPAISPSAAVAPGCPVTNDCDTIRTLMGKTCSSSHYIQCLKRKEATR